MMRLGSRLTRQCGWTPLSLPNNAEVVRNGFTMLETTIALVEHGQKALQLNPRLLSNAFLAGAGLCPEDCTGKRSQNRDESPAGNAG